MGHETIVCQKQDSISLITLNRPTNLNTLTIKMFQELEDVLIELERDDEVGVVIFTGARRPDGQPCFCAGADIKDMAKKGSITFYAQFPSSKEALFKALQSFAKGTDYIIDRGVLSVFDQIANFPKPTIAAIDGICTAGGFELALACDLRIVAESAQICDLHIKNIGHLGGAGLETRLTQLVGAAKAKELVWTGDIIDGNEAWRIGLANRVFPSNEMLDKTKELARQIASSRRDTVKLSKLLIDAKSNMSERESLRYTDVSAALLNQLAPEVTNEGYKAFVEKRKPSF